jgi:hypothetical protein
VVVADTGVDYIGDTDGIGNYLVYGSIGILLKKSGGSLKGFAGAEKSPYLCSVKQQEGVLGQHQI